MAEGRSLSPAPSHKEAALDFLRLVAAGRVADAYRSRVGPAFRHHNPWFPSDAASLRAGMEEAHARFPAKLFEVQRAVEEGELVAVHSRLRLAADQPEMAVVHIFRFEGALIAELWDVGQAAPPEILNERGMF